MGDPCNCRKQNLTAVWVVITLLIVAIIGGGVYYYTQNNKIEKSDQIEQIKLNDVPTLQMRLAEHESAVAEDHMIGIYLALPNILLENIYKNIGLNATKFEVAEEYLRNREYYISLQVTEAAKNIKLIGPDAENIETINVTTTLKPESQGTPIHALPRDSLRK